MKSLVLKDVKGHEVIVPLQEVFGSHVAHMVASDEVISRSDRDNVEEIGRTAMNMIKLSLQEFFGEDKEGSISIVMMKNPSTLTHELLVRRHRFEE